MSEGEDDVRKSFVLKRSWRNENSDTKITSTGNWFSAKGLRRNGIVWLNVLARNKNKLRKFLFHGLKHFPPRLGMPRSNLCCRLHRSNILRAPASIRKSLKWPNFQFVLENFLYATFTKACATITRTYIRSWWMRNWWTTRILIQAQ